MIFTTGNYLPVKFSLNVFTEFTEFFTEIFVTKSFEPATSCGQNQDATTAPARRR